MKVVILAGGFGTRLSEETAARPKPMIEIGGRPMLWHVMQHYAAFGHTEFIICAGYKQEVIRAFAASDDTKGWQVTVADTGLETMTGGRLKRIAPLLCDQPFFLTYGDGLCDVDLDAELAFHRACGKVGTVCAVHPEPRFGFLDLEGERVTAFREKNRADAGWINGGFMIFEPRVLDYISGDDCVLERAPMQELCCENELAAYRHEGFWQCMDTLHDKNKLEELWRSGKAPWVRRED